LVSGGLKKYRVTLVAPKNRDIAMAFKNCAFYPQMSVFDNLAFGLKLWRFPKT
jgi:multiple sugar transport system ATP-binding protein